MAVNYTTAQAASGNLIISITPQIADDFIFVASSAVYTGSGSTPAGWTRFEGGCYTKQVDSTDLLTFNMADLSPSAEWAAIMVDYPTIGTPALDGGENVDFGTGPETQYVTTITTHDGDAIVYQICGAATSVPTFSISDSA